MSEPINDRFSFCIASVKEIRNEHINKVILLIINLLHTTTRFTKVGSENLCYLGQSMSMLRKQTGVTHCLNPTVHAAK